jgi:hypothetical protein
MTSTPESLADLNKRIEEEEKRYDEAYNQVDEEKEEDPEHYERLKKFQSYLFSGNCADSLTTDELLSKIVGIIDNDFEGAKIIRDSDDIEKEPVSAAMSGEKVKKYEYYYKGVKYQSDEPLHDEEDSYNSEEN